jgi:hypothetical protein
MNSHSVQVVAAVAQSCEQLGRRDQLSGCWSPPAHTPLPLPPGQDCEHWHETRADPLADGDGGSLLLLLAAKQPKASRRASLVRCEQGKRRAVNEAAPIDVNLN